MLYGRLRAAVEEWRNRFPRRVSCNICGWAGSKFASDSWHPHTICCRCGSQVRHRLLVAALQEPRFANILTAKRVLHFAPEALLSDVFRREAVAYVTANINGSAQLRLDITSMPEISDNSYDAVVACDVLEHVRNDRDALAEIRRVLSPDGFAILTVPQKDGLADTYEDSSITNPSDRERHFGQWDHLRIYGDSFPLIVEDCGFRVSTIDAASFAQAVVKRHVLFPPIVSSHPLATNHRRIFFGQKIA